MEMAVWILFCLFASVGLVECGFWLREAMKKHEKSRRGYHVLPLYDNIDDLEAQIRFGLSLLKRAGLDGEFILLVDMGLSEECQKICDNLIRGIGGVYICAKSDIGETIQQLDDLQRGGAAFETR